MNTIVLMGRLARDPETKLASTQKGQTKVSRFPLVVKRNRTSKAFVVMITAYGNKQERNEYRQLIHDNIEYEILCQSYGTGQVEELVELMLDAICSTKTYQQINGEAVPTQVVKSRLLKVGYEHIQYVFFSLDRSTSKVKNIRQYMLTVLYNAPATISQFYDAEVRHDMYWGKDIPDG